MTPEEEELLAELRKISDKSGGRSRFKDDDEYYNDKNNDVGVTKDTTTTNSIHGSKKQLTPKKKTPLKSHSNGNDNSNGTSKSTSKSTSTSTSTLTSMQKPWKKSKRFRESGIEVEVRSGGSELIAETLDTAAESVDQQTQTRDKTSNLPPWKQKSVTKKSSSSSSSSSQSLKPTSTFSDGDNFVVIQNADDGKEIESKIVSKHDNTSMNFNNTSDINNPTTSSSKINTQGTGFQSSSLPNTFNGDRGGPAEDAELLAELLAISNKSRTQTTAQNDKKSDSNKPTTTIPKPHTPLTSNNNTSQTMTSSPNPQPSILPPPVPPVPPVQPVQPPPPDSDFLVTRDTIPEALQSKLWKTRKAAYEFLISMLSVKNSADEGQVDSNSLVHSLDSKVCIMVKDSNLGALDSALQFAYLYANYCTSASQASQAANITTQLLKGAALSSRPTTVQRAKQLILKLMEVSSDGVSSIHAIVEVLLTNGITDRKPKIVLQSAQLVLDTALSFGAVTLPIGAISVHAPKMLSHTNGPVRDLALDLLAEICRSLGGKQPLQAVIDNMKNAQQNSLDELLQNQSSPTPPKIRLRSNKDDTLSADENNPGPSNHTQSLQANLDAIRNSAKAEEAKKYASKTAVNILSELKKTDFESKLAMMKWSEKTAALDIMIKCGGDKPYKMVHPSSSVSYVQIIGDLKKLLSHTHFAVNSKALQCIAMLAQGTGETLYSKIKPLIKIIAGLAKDKKLTRVVGETLDQIFGHVVGLDLLLDPDDGIPSWVLDEKKNKNALARKCSLEFLQRCIDRAVVEEEMQNDSFTVDPNLGPLAVLTPKAGEAAAQLCLAKVNDTDATVRKAATDLFASLLSVEDSSIAAAITPTFETLKSENIHVYKTLDAKRNVSTEPGQNTPDTSKSLSTIQPKPKLSSSPLRNKPIPSVPRPRPNTTKIAKKQEKDDSDILQETTNLPSFEDALAFISSLDIPEWDTLEGIHVGLQSNEWKERKQAIDNLSEFTSTSPIAVNMISGKYASNLCIVVKQYTKNFKESNFNLSKSIMELFSSLCKLHASVIDTENKMVQPLDSWICKAATILSTEKISDKKFAQIAPKLLTSLCEVKQPKYILVLVISALEKIKSPLPHEGMLKWVNNFFDDFGTVVIGDGLNDVLKWVLKECENSNPKVKGAAQALMGTLHKNLGPVVKALLTSFDLSSNIKVQVENAMKSTPFDKVEASRKREKKCYVVHKKDGNSSGNDEGSESHSNVIKIPKIDLISKLPGNIMKNLDCKEGKKAWFTRKTAMDEVESALLSCNGLVSTEPQNCKPLMELTKLLKERLSDSQGNLKPFSCKLVGILLNSVDYTFQPKLGRIVYGPLLNIAMNDSKKNVRDAVMQALTIGVEKSEIDGGGINDMTMEVFLGAFISELNKSENKGGGVPEVLKFVSERAEFLPSLESINSPRARGLEEQFGVALVSCLTASKVDTRSAAETLIESCISQGSLSAKSCEKGIKKLSQAQQRTVQLIMTQILGDNLSIASTERASTPRRPPRSSSTRKTRPSSTVKGSGRFSTGIQGSVGKDSPGSSRRKEDSIGTLADMLKDPSFNPLKSSGNVSSTKMQRYSPLARQRNNWPDYPEEPSGVELLDALKKLWAPMLPPRSISVLFPKRGIQKQEVATEGADLLLHAMSSSDENGLAVLDNLDLIYKWIAYAICSRESTTGMQQLCSLVVKLFGFLRKQRYQMNDYESLLLLPYIFDKAGVVKGRFRELFDDILSSLSQGDICSAAIYGSLICVSVIEKSTNAKTRVIATRECKKCVLGNGLSSIGRKGIQVSAKSLSEENLAENRVVLLDLIEVVVSKMNNDLPKYFKNCGLNLSSKARELIKERIVKHGKQEQGRRPLNPARASLTPQRKQMSGDRNISDRRKQISGTKELDLPTYNRSDSLSTVSRSLNLRLESSSSLEEGSSTAFAKSDEAFTFSYSNNNTVVNRDPSPISNQDEGTSLKKYLNSTKENASQNNIQEDVQKNLNSYLLSTGVQVSSPSDMGRPSTSGTAAASLRERLQNIRKKHMSIANESPVANEVTNIPLQTSKFDIYPSNEVNENLSPTTSSYQQICADARKLLSKQTPISEADETFPLALDGLRKIHASLSSGPTQTITLEERESIGLRRSIKDDISSCVDIVSCLFHFGFNCNPSSFTEGLSLSLLSVSIATLMAIFLDKDLSILVPQNEVASVIKNATSGLLDPRLSATSDEGKFGLDDSTCKKMVKAINKLAIQATYGASRHIAFQTLLSLQLELCTLCVNKNISSDDATNTTNRMSRIVTKLFSRLVKAEESELQPFSENRLDIESLLCTLEDVLVDCNTLSAQRSNVNEFDNNKIKPCKNMGRAMMLHLLKAKSKEGKSYDLKLMLDKLDLGNASSLFVSCCHELGLDTAEEIETRKASADEVDEELSELIYAVGGAGEEGDRVRALNKLRDYMARNQTADLESHLSNLSAQFRLYILQQLKMPLEFDQLSGMGDSSKSVKNDSSEDSKAPSMAQRLKSIKSKINAAEATAQSIIIPGDDQSINTYSTNISGVSALRERLQKANNRATALADGKLAGMSENHSLGNAATLRARLETFRNTRQSMPNMKN